MNTSPPITGLTFNIEVKTGRTLNTDQSDAGYTISGNVTSTRPFTPEDNVAAELDVFRITEVVDVGPIDAHGLDSAKIFLQVSGDGLACLDVHVAADLVLAKLTRIKRFEQPFT